MPDLHIERVVVTGGRGFTNGARIEADLRTLLPFGLGRVAQGGNGIDEQFGGGEAPKHPRSADTLAWLAAAGLGLTEATYRPNRELDGRWLLGRPDGVGNGQFPRRNIRMLESEKPDLVLAYPDPSSRGTWHCVEQALARGVSVAVWSPGTQTLRVRNIVAFDDAPRFILRPPMSMVDAQHLAEVLHG